MINSIISQFKKGLQKTSQQLNNRLGILFNQTNNKIEFMEKLEELLILSDIGVFATNEILEKFEQIDFQNYKHNDFNYFKERVKETLIKILEDNSGDFTLDSKRLNIIMIVGVNGSGKTTIAAKMAHLFKQEQFKILLVPADTFRAAGIQQLKFWSNQVGVEMINSTEGADPAAVVYDGIKAGQARNKNILIIDTAGRLHTQKNLMNELEKIKRIIKREAPDSPLEIIQVIDATMGQNAISQANIFKNTLGLTGLILTKMDGTAKGGIIIAIKKELKIPIKFISLGEKINDLYYFDANNFINALLDVS